MAGRVLTRFRPTLSHLGIDVALDRRNRIFLLDFNPVPGRGLLTPSMRKRVTYLTTGFAKYLASRGASARKR
ncbi:YheC/YheD family protein [Paenibacillus sp. CC-CFT747]|nr:YheC/YheD family protein [Paenibacillus sp. CC-CFT747]